MLGEGAGGRRGPAGSWLSRRQAPFQQPPAQPREPVPLSEIAPRTPRGLPITSERSPAPPPAVRRSALQVHLPQIPASQPPAPRKCLTEPHFVWPLAMQIPRPSTFRRFPQTSPFMVTEPPRSLRSRGSGLGGLRFELPERACAGSQVVVGDPRLRQPFTPPPGKASTLALTPHP